MASKLGVKPKAATHKGRKMLEKREPKLIENPKKCIIMKGRKSSQTINDLLKDL
jgi:ribosome production factor 2